MLTAHSNRSIPCPGGVPLCPIDPFDAGTLTAPGAFVSFLLSLDSFAFLPDYHTLVCDRLNATPRKCLGWKTPAEVFREKMMEEMGRPPYPQKQ